jgi:putative CocE/NonD family hydrolase
MVKHFVLGLLFLLPLSGLAQTRVETPPEHTEWVRENYTKHVYRIPMRDGVELYTHVYTPTFIKEKLPFILMRTPYKIGPYNSHEYRKMLGPYPEFDREGFIFVYQNVRGRFLSEGTFVNMRPHKPDSSAANDTYDTIEWLLKNIPNHNGKVGMRGISYPGFQAAAGMINSHPALKAVAPQAPIADWFWDDMHHHGAFSLALAFRFFSFFGIEHHGQATDWPVMPEFGMADGYDFYMEMGPTKNADKLHFKGENPFWNKLVAHPNYDQFWQDRNILPHLNNITASVLVVGGWFDSEDLYGPLEIYKSIEQRNPGISNQIVMGPWSHGGWTRTQGRVLGAWDFQYNTAQNYRDHIELPFFLKHLKDKGSFELAEAFMFETGSNRWRSFESWPPKVEKASWYFNADGVISRKKGASEGADHYVSDPDNPVPYTVEVTNSWGKSFMGEDQRQFGRRPDVLTYRSEVLQEDVTVAGPILAKLYVSLLGIDDAYQLDQKRDGKLDADFIVKVIDQWPDEIPGVDRFEDPEGYLKGGTQALVRYEAMRGRFRDSYETPKPFKAGEPTLVELPLQDVLHTFKKGHRIVIQIQSSFFPFFDRNPQKYVDNIFHAEESDYQKLRISLLRTKDQASAIEFGILE